MLLGRTEHERTIAEALASAEAGRGRLVLVSGEAGIGKSTLAAQIGSLATERGATLTWGRAWEFADAPPYFPVIPCLRELGVAVGTDAFQLWEEVAAALAKRKSGRPTTVWILEDLHVADLGTLDLLTFLAQPLRSMNALIVATTRDADPRLSDRMRQRLTRMARDGIDLRLTPLGAEDVTKLTESLTKRKLPADAIRRLVALTGGNPLFVVECARAFKDAGGIEAALDTLPSTVRQIVMERVELLPRATRDALACGAVLGREMSAAAVARMLDVLPARVIDTLLSALRSGIITETKPGHFMFGHAIVRDAIEDAIAPDERGRLHARAENALAAMGDKPDVVVERARHALVALHLGHDSPNVGPLVAKAATMLEADGAFDRALELLQRQREAQATTNEQDLHLAHVARLAGRSDVTRQVCQDVIARIRADDGSAGNNADLFARAVLLHASDVRPGVIDRHEVGLLEEALSRLRPGPLACRVRARLATAHQPTMDQSVPMSITRKAIDDARRWGDDAAIIDVLENARWGLFSAPLTERLALARELVERVTRAERLGNVVRAYEALAFCELEAGELAAFDRAVTTALELAAHPRDRWRALLLASMRALMKGNFIESERHVTEVAHLGALVDDLAFATAMALHDLLRLRLQRRDDEMLAALAKAEEMLGDMFEGAVQRALSRATCLAARGDAEATRKALDIIGGQAAIFQQDPTAAALLARAVALAGTPDECRACREGLASVEGRDLPADVVAFVYDGPVGRLRGLLDARLGDLASAKTCLREAYDLVAQRGHRPFVAQIAYELATLGETAFLDEALTLGGELGMVGLVNDALALGGTSREPRTKSEQLEARTEMVKRDDGLWHVTWGSRSVTLKDSRGVQLLARLVERPGEEIHVLSLASDEGGASLAETTAGEVIDEEARATYRSRIADLEAELQEAERCQDQGRLSVLQREREALLDELRRATGLRGRVRVAGSVTERARVNVQRRLKDAVQRIAQADPRLGRHFERAVRSGTFCSFRP